MFGKYVLSLAALVLLVAVVSIHAAPQPEALESDVQLVEEFEVDTQEIAEVRMNKFVKKVLEILKKAFKDVAKHCLEGAAKHCKEYWYSPLKAISCATEYFAGFCQGY